MNKLNTNEIKDSKVLIWKCLSNLIFQTILYIYNLFFVNFAGF